MPTPTVHVFEPYRLLPSQRLLLRDGQPLKLGGRAFDGRVALVERRQRVVCKRELMGLEWAWCGPASSSKKTACSSS